jgi:glyoxalase family protein
MRYPAAMRPTIASLHHVTATVDQAQPDLDFCTRLLGLRLVKKTVNFDNRHVYHFYYGDERGTPGTIWTTFPYHGRGVRVGTKGAGQITVTSFSVPAESLAYWTERFMDAGVAVTPVDPRFGEESVVVSDPSGLLIELVGTRADERRPWTGGDIPASAAVRGLHSVTMTVRETEASATFMTKMLGYEVIAEEKNRLRLGLAGGGTGRQIDLLVAADAPAAVNGIGTVHHVAMAITDDAAQLQLREALVGLGYQVTPVMDRQYFRSIYFREPGGVLFEVATVAPGFTVDEPLESLGRGLKLPPWEEPHRADIERGLTPVVHG